MATLIARAAFGSLPPLRSVRLPNAILLQTKCVYYVLTQIVYNVTLDTQFAPTDGTHALVGDDVPKTDEYRKFYVLREETARVKAFPCEGRWQP